jgi:hypothetical protein
MAYDFVVIDVTRKQRLGGVGLSIAEQMDLVELAQELKMPLLASLPEYWGGDDLEIPIEQLQSLLDELTQVETLPSTSPTILSAVEQIRGMTDLAIRNGCPLKVIPE